MGHYYCLMAGLPEIFLDTKQAKTVGELKEECYDVLSKRDKKLLYYFFLRYDCLNLVKLLKDPDAETSPYGNFVMDQYKDLIKSAREMNFNVHRFPAFMSEYARTYEFNSSKDSFFPEDAMMQAYYEFALKCPNKLMADWYSFNFNVTNILTGLIARHNGLNVSKYILGNNEVTEMIRNNKAKDFDLTREFDYVVDLMKVAEETDPVTKEKKIDAFRWEWLDGQLFIDSFSIEALFIYFCKLEMLERWKILDVEEGKARFRQIIENLRGEAKVPDEFIKNDRNKKQI